MTENPSDKRGIFKNVNSAEKEEEKHLRLYILIAAVVLLIVMIVLIAVKCSARKNRTRTARAANPHRSHFEAADIDPLDRLSGFKAQGKRPIAVVVNNPKPARPQWGLWHPRYRV